jgi:hypothetical protein
VLCQPTTILTIEQKVQRKRRGASGGGLLIDAVVRTERLEIREGDILASVDILNDQLKIKSDLEWAT